MYCGDDCRCYYNQSFKTNVFVCSGPRYTQLPTIVPNLTNWMLLDGTNIKKLSGDYPYLQSSTPDNTMSYISLKHANIQAICPQTLNSILHKSSVKWLDLSYNNMTELSTEFSKPSNIEKLWLKGNPIYCYCQMSWMVNWLGNRGKRIVQDLEDITCVHGMEVGNPIYSLRPYDMGCYPKQVGMWIAIGIIGGLITLMVLAVGPVTRYIDVRWFVYKYFGKLVGNPDENEDQRIMNMQYDAFLTFR